MSDETSDTGHQTVFEPRRRGRPPMDRPVETQVAADEPVPASARRRGKKIGIAALKLTAPTRQGYVRRFFNATPDRIAEAERLGYTIVRDPGIQTHGPGSSTNRHSGTDPNSGAGLKQILMETPEELYAEGVAEREDHNRQIDDAIRAGRDFTGRLNPQESYGQGSIKIER